MNQYCHDDLAERFRALEAKLAELHAENLELIRELDRTREWLAYHQSLNVERIGFLPTAPPGTYLNEE
jgi:hypothetical protein